MTNCLTAILVAAVMMSAAASAVYLIRTIERLSEHMMCMRKIQRNLFALNLIKVHWILSAEVSYRPQKRVETTRRRYITFYKKPLYEFMTGVNGRIDA